MVDAGADDAPLAHRLSAAADEALVGRRRERSRLVELLAPGAHPVVFVHGPGGIGKTALVRAAVGDAGRRPIWLDARGVEPTPAGLLGELAGSLGTPAHGLDGIAAAWRTAGAEVLVIDAYERFAVVDDWLRNDLLPLLPASTTTLLVGRNRPNVAWRTTPGWRHLLAELLVGPLTEADAAALVARRDLPAGLADTVVRFGRGHPLALELAVEAFARQPDLQLDAGPPPEVVEELLDVLLDDLGPDDRSVVEAASVLRRVTEPLLAAVTDRPDAEGRQRAWRVLRDLPLTVVGPSGLELNRVVQDVVAGGLELRDPGRVRELRRRAAAVALDEVERAPGWDATADLLHLVQNPLVRNAFLPPPGLHHPVEAARDGDADAVFALAGMFDDERQVEVLRHWWRRHPEGFRVLRGAAGEVRAFNLVLAADAVDPSLAADDPVIAVLAADLDARPLPTGARALVVRRALAASTGDAPSADLAAMYVDIKRTYLELRPRLARVYAVGTGGRAGDPTVRAMGFVPVRTDVAIGRNEAVLSALDFGPASVDGWLAGHVELESVVADDLDPTEPSPPDGATAADQWRPSPTSSPLARLSAREREVLASLAEGLTNRELAERLFISERTANRHLSNIFTKLGVHNRTAAARMAVEAGLV